MMDIRLAVGAAVIGYLLGAISMARLIGRIFAPGMDVSRQEYQVLEDDRISLDIASATNVSTKLGSRFGCLVSLLDMLKVFAPTLFFKLAFPEAPYFLFAASTGVIGHNFPLYHHFKGGGGLSAVLGGLLAVDWLAVVVTLPVGLILGMGLLRDAYVGSTLWLFFLIPWFWIRTHRWPYVAYAAAVIISFILATIPLTRQYLRIRKKGPQALRSFYEEFPMGRGLVKMGRFFGLYKKE
jgi:glycerol-3-phosphate acyltransferase PlsY